MEGCVILHFWYRVRLPWVKGWSPWGGGCPVLGKGAIPRVLCLLIHLWLLSLPTAVTL